MFIAIFLLWTALCGDVESVLIEVEQGLLRGEIKNKSTGNGQFCSFKGIPYATPPIGELRFKAPLPALPWRGVRNATKHGATCPEINVVTGEYIPGDEDCLFLNVYTPTTNVNASLPVMVYFGGEGFVSGTSNEDRYGPDFLLDHNVVVVTVNYRVGPLGFLCLHIREVPGNAGLKDQVQSLRWIKKNICQFGGDPNTVTIFGQSSGGSSVAYHAFSPMSKGLFKRAIAMSRISFNDFIFEPKRQSMILAHRVGHYTENPYEAFRFLQNASVKDIMNARPCTLNFYKIKSYVLRYLIFFPVVEKNFGDEHFILEDSQNLLLKNKTNDIELMLGLTSMEGITRGVSQRFYNFKIFPYLKEIFVPIRIGYRLDQSKLLQLGSRVQNHYFGDKEVSEKNLKEFIKLYSYLVYDHKLYRFLEMWVKTGRSVYFYRFSCYTERNIYGLTGAKYGVKAAGHLDDLMYLFDGKKYNITLDKEKPSYTMIKQTCTLFTNFAKYGNPTPDESLDIIWHPYNRNQSVMDIDLKLTQYRDNKLDEIDLWRKLYKSAGRRFS